MAMVQNMGTSRDLAMTCEGSVVIDLSCINYLVYQKTYRLKDCNSDVFLRLWDFYIYTILHTNNNLEIDHNNDKGIALSSMQL